MQTATPVYESEIQVRLFECDFSGRWKPAAFFQNLTEIAGGHAAQLGFGFEQMTPRSLAWVHSRIKIQFLRFPASEERLTVRTWPKTIQQKLFYVRDFEVLDVAGEPVALATSAWLVINTATRHLVPPAALDIKLPEAGRSALDERLDKLVLDRPGEERHRLRAGYSAVDVLGHVNNSRYVEWICDAFPMEQYRQRQIAWMQINYDHEVLPGEEISIRSCPADGSESLWMVEGFNLARDTRSFAAAVAWQPIPSGESAD